MKSDQMLQLERRINDNLGDDKGNLGDDKGNLGDDKGNLTKLYVGLRSNLNNNWNFH